MTQPPPDTGSPLIAAADFGILPDQDSTAGFTALGKRLREFPEREWVVTFAPGAYQVRDPAWLDSVQQVRLIGPGASLRQATPSMGLFGTSEPLISLAWSEPFLQPRFTHNPGIRVASAAPGSRSLRALELVGPLAPGSVALLAGLAQQFQNLHLPEDQWQLNGWPPNFRWFEWVEIAAVDGDSITLEAPLRFAYDENWRDYPGGYFGPYVGGAPRLYLCDRADWHIPRRIEFHGFTFLRSVDTGPEAGHIGFMPALSLHLEDCTIGPGGFVGACREIAMLRCNWPPGIEVDKLISRLVIEDCDLGMLTSDGAGALEVEIRRSRVYGDFRINPRTSVLIDGSTAFGNFSLNALHGALYVTDPSKIAVRATRP